MQRPPEEGKVTGDMLTSTPSCSDSPKLLPCLCQIIQKGTSFEGSNTNPMTFLKRESNIASTYDLVEQMHYLYVRVVKAKNLTGKDVKGYLDPYVEVRLGNCRGTTRHFVMKSSPVWNQVFAFPVDQIQTSVLEVNVQDKDAIKGDCVGRVMFDLNEIPKRVPPDSPLAPRWYTLEDKNGIKVEGELMLAVWMGTQADEAFSESRSKVYFSKHSNSATDALVNMRAKVYFSPKLWYLRVNVIEAQDLIPGDRIRSPEVYVKAFLGNQELITKVSMRKTVNPIWNEDLTFIAAEPFLEPLILSVEDRVASNKDVVLGKCLIPLQCIDRRLDHRPVNSKWYNLEKHIILDGEKKEINFASRIHTRLYFEGGYHVLDEPTHYSSDFRPTAKQLWKSRIGLLELGILNAQGLPPMKSKDGMGSTDAYCVAKYGQKWVRTRTVIDSLAPKWNEQNSWEVFDLCTVLSIGVFDNCHLQEGRDKSGGARDSKIGKIRIRLSLLETDRVYIQSYPLLALYPTGVKKMGEIHLAVRFTCKLLMNMINMYSQTLLPKMHYIHPLTVTQLDRLKHHTTQIVSMKLSRAEPPLRKEIVEYMLDVDSYIWSMRKIKVNIFRMMDVLGGLIAIGKWFDHICNWKNPIMTLVIHILFLILVIYPKHILPSIFLSLSLIIVWRYRYRPYHPPFMDIHFSCADNAHLDELDEEFDTFPTSRQIDTVRIRYDRLKSIAGRVQTLLGDLATQGERLQSLLSWSDPRATSLFVIFCSIAAIALFVTPFRVVAFMTGFYVLRPPWFRRKLPSILLNFFRRLPAKTDIML